MDISREVLPFSLVPQHLWIPSHFESQDSDPAVSHRSPSKFRTAAEAFAAFSPKAQPKKSLSQFSEQPGRPVPGRSNSVSVTRLSH